MPFGLTVEFLRAPEQAVITDPSPEFAWIVPNTVAQQKAFRILVASSPYLLREGAADLWDSGQQSNSQSLNITYAGKALAANSIYWWQLKIWSGDEAESEYSEPQQFVTGDFDRSQLAYPSESRWVQLASGQWVSEDKQRADFHYFPPVERSESEAGHHFVAFEKSVIGILTFTASAKQDHTPITVYLGERKTEESAVDKNPGRSNIGYQKIEMTLKKGTHYYVLKLAERSPSNYLHSQKLAPHYPEVMPFRYAEIVGEPDTYQLFDPQQAALFYYFDEEGSAFACSDAALETVWDFCKYTLKATPFLGVYADGNRERMPYEADAYIQQLGHFAVDREYAIGRYTINFLLDHASWPTEWQMHVILMGWEYYMATGDAELLDQRYEDFKRKSLIALTEKNHLISTRTDKKTEAFLRELNFPGPVKQFRDIVDWPHGHPKDAPAASNQSPLQGGETDGFVFDDYNAVVNAFHYRSLVLMAKIAEVTERSEDQQWFEKRAKTHHSAYMDTFFDQKEGVFRDGEKTMHASLHGNMFPLAFGMVPNEHLTSVGAFVKSRGMACSVYGAQYLLEALYMAGEDQYALELMTSDSKRSWLNMMRVGSSMTTEAWDEYFKPNLTWNHAWGSAPANIVARKLIGIEALSPAYQRFRIAPQPANLENVSLQLPTASGTISCSLQQKAGEWLMEIEVPGNTEAELWLPTGFEDIILNGEPTEFIRSVTYVGAERQVLKLLCGKNIIRAKR